MNIDIDEIRAWTRDIHRVMQLLRLLGTLTKKALALYRGLNLKKIGEFYTVLERHLRFDFPLLLNYNVVHALPA